MSASTGTPNYQVTAENSAGLLFKNKRDRKILNVDPKVLNVRRETMSFTVSNNFRIKSFVPEMLYQQTKPLEDGQSLKV